jgi:hypothetical protein
VQSAKRVPVFGRIQLLIDSFTLSQHHFFSSVRFLLLGVLVIDSLITSQDYLVNDLSERFLHFEGMFLVTLS